MLWRGRCAPEVGGLWHCWSGEERPPREAATDEVRWHCGLYGPGGTPFTLAQLHACRNLYIHSGKPLIR